MDALYIYFSITNYCFPLNISKQYFPTNISTRIWAGYKYFRVLLVFLLLHTWYNISVGKSRGGVLYCCTYARALTTCTRVYIQQEDRCAKAIARSRTAQQRWGSLRQKNRHCCGNRHFTPRILPLQTLLRLSKFTAQAKRSVCQGVAMRDGGEGVRL